MGTGNALSFPANTHRFAPNDGLLLLAGGVGHKSAELFGFATIKTEKDDYAPGETVTITGSGWQPGEWVALVLKESPTLDEHPLVDVRADDNGNIESTEFSPDEHDTGIRFYLSVYGEELQAQTTFTDGNLNGVTLDVRKSDCTTSSLSFLYGDTVCIASQVSVGGGGTNPDYLLQWINPSNAVAFTDTHSGVSDGATFSDSHAITAVGNWTAEPARTRVVAAEIWLRPNHLQSARPPRRWRDSSRIRRLTTARPSPPISPS